MLPTIPIFSIQSSMGRKINRTVKESEEERKVRMNKQRKSVKEKNTGQGKKKSK